MAAAILALNCAVLYYRNDPKHLGRFRLVVLLESLYFLLLLPASVNHLVGSTLSTSAFLNFYTGVSTLLQAVIIFPSLLILSQKLRDPQNPSLIKKWVCIAVPLYVLGFWIRHALFWIYALSSLAPIQDGCFEAVGFIDSWLTLLAASIVTAVACFRLYKKGTLNLRLVGVAVLLVGVYFAIYDLIAVWQPIYRAFFPLTDFWMLTLTILAIAILLKDHPRR